MAAAKMRRMMGIWVCCLLTGCYYSPELRQEKANPSFLSEGEAESLVQKKLAPYGIKFVFNMKLKRDGVVFTADGYDRDLRVGYEYRSHQGMDFEDEDDQSPQGLSDSEIESLYERQKKNREYFLIIPEGPREDVVAAVDKFVEDLYSWEVLKKAKPKKKKQDALFPDEKKDKDALPWEATGDLKKKRKQMEASESLEGKPGEPASDVPSDVPMDGWGSVDTSGPDSEGLGDDEWGDSGGGQDDDEWGAEPEEGKDDEWGAEPEEGKDDEWGSDYDEEDF